MSGVHGLTTYFWTHHNTPVTLQVVLAALIGIQKPRKVETLHTLPQGHRVQQIHIFSYCFIFEWVAWNQAAYQIDVPDVKLKQASADRFKT